MQFGIWVEPEMVNPDSTLFRNHPQWVLTDDRYEPILHRHQLVLDLTHPEAFAYIHTALDRLLGDHEIDFVKWDMNRPHIHAADQRGAAGTHRQTLALYRLLDRLRADHRSVEIESCASGGGRIDHAILQRTDRVWTSDSNDALERQRIQYGASMLIPPELMGAHIGPRRAHTTGRVHDIGFRAITSLFGHFGIEADLTEFDERELEVLRAVIDLYRRHRDLLHHGDTVRFDLEPPWLSHGVYATDRSRALVSVTALDSSPIAATAPLRLIGLDDERRYRITPIPLPQVTVVANIDPPAWWSDAQLVATGRQLAAHGLRLPSLLPASAVLIQLEAIDEP
jgi:alpha-galactosidase